MDYKVEIRTDIIDPYTYLQIELNYKELLETIYSCGGFALYRQIYKWFGSKPTGFKEIKKLEELQLLGSRDFNNNKYVYLKISSLKYLKYRDYQGKVIDPKISRPRIEPGFRPIANSVYALEYLFQRKEHINTSISVEVFKKLINKAREQFNRDRFSNLHLGKIVKDDYVEKLNAKLKILGERNAIFLKNYNDSNDLKSSVLEFVYFDFNQELIENPILKVTKLISKFLNNIGTTGKNNLLNCCSFSLEVITVSDERKEVLEKLKQQATCSISEKNNFYLNRGMKPKENQVISNLKDIKIDVLEDIEGYFRNAIRNDDYNFVSETVINRLENLKEQLRGDD